MLRAQTFVKQLTGKKAILSQCVVQTKGVVKKQNFFISAVIPWVPEPAAVLISIKLMSSRDNIPPDPVKCSQPAQAPVKALD